MKKTKQRAREITQAQKQKRQEKAEEVLPSRPVCLDRKVTVRLDVDRFDQLEDYARREGFTVSLIVRHLLCRFLEDQRRLEGRRS